MKNFESNAASFVRGLPLSHVQSAKAKGSALGFFSGVAAGSDTTAAGTARATGVFSELFTRAVVIATSVTATGCFSPRCFSCFSSSSMRFFIASSSSRISCGTFC